MTDTREIFVAVTVPADAKITRFEYDVCDGVAGMVGRLSGNFRIIDNTQEPVGKIILPGHGGCEEFDGEPDIEITADLEKMQQELAGVEAVYLDLFIAPQPTTWTSCAQGFPPNDEPVLVYVPGNQFLNFAIDQWCMQREAPVSFSSATIDTGFGWCDHDHEEVTHWMPLSAPLPEDKHG